VRLYRSLFDHHPEVIVVDRHPDYRSSMLGRRLADETGARLVEIQHHAAHLGSVLADTGWPVDGGPVIGLMLDGLGYGSDGSIWGGEVLLGDYREWRRIAHLRAFSLPGGARAILEPWRCLYAQLDEAFGWTQLPARWRSLSALESLQRQPLDMLGEMIRKGLNTPRTTSAGRLFDAVAAALGVCADGIAYEAQAAIELEALARMVLPSEDSGYDFRLETTSQPWVLDPEPMWRGLLDDLAAGVAPARVAARFHFGLGVALARLAERAAEIHGVETVALSGGVFQNRTLFEITCSALRERSLRTLSHRRVPANDGGLALGQAVIGALA
jgi:hydrogenase maturation protein HypF